ALGDDSDVRLEGFRQDHQLGGGPQVETERIVDDGLAADSEWPFGHRWLLGGHRHVLLDGIVSLGSPRRCGARRRGMTVWPAIRPGGGMRRTDLARLWHLVFKGSNHPGIFFLL